MSKVLSAVLTAILVIVLVFAVVSAATTSGTVYEDSNCNGTIDFFSDGALSNALVKITNGTYQQNTHTASDGTYVFTGVPSGIYNVVVFYDNRMTPASQQVVLGGVGGPTGIDFLHLCGLAY